MIRDLLGEQIVSEEELWDSVALKLGQVDPESTRMDLDWIKREVRLWKKPDDADAAPAAAREKR